MAASHHGDTLRSSKTVISGQTCHRLLPLTYATNYPPSTVAPRYFRACYRTVQGGPNRVTIVAVVLALQVCDQGNLYRVLGCVTTRGWLVANFVDPYPSIPLAGHPDDPVRVLGARDGR